MIKTAANNTAFVRHAMPRMKAVLNGTFGSDSRRELPILLLWDFRAVCCGALCLDISRFFQKARCFPAKKRYFIMAWAQLPLSITLADMRKRIWAHTDVVYRRPSAAKYLNGHQGARFTAGTLAEFQSLGCFGLGCLKLLLPPVALRTTSALQNSEKKSALRSILFRNFAKPQRVSGHCKKTS